MAAVVDAIQGQDIAETFDNQLFKNNQETTIKKKCSGDLTNARFLLLLICMAQKKIKKVLQPHSL